MVIKQPMMPTIELIRPLTFIDGEKYLFVEHLPDKDVKLVQFLNYDPCPAIIIVRASDGQVIRCLRDDLFSIKVNDRPSQPLQSSALLQREKESFCKTTMPTLSYP